jgi:7-keto-8-aminopelargonate synthetase-like enzyme
VLHEELEARLAQFLGKEACLVFSTGFLSNQGALSTLVGRNDVIYSDRENHASIVEGTMVALEIRLNFATIIWRFGTSAQKYPRKIRRSLNAADGVFSMSGEIFDIKKASQLAKAYNCRLYIDDAHALGVLGPQGQGDWAPLQNGRQH